MYLLTTTHSVYLQKMCILFILLFLLPFLGVLLVFFSISAIVELKISVGNIWSVWLIVIPELSALARRLCSKYLVCPFQYSFIIGIRMYVRVSRIKLKIYRTWRNEERKIIVNGRRVRKISCGNKRNKRRS